MEELKLQDVNLSEERLVFIEKFARKIEKNESGILYSIIIVLYIILFWVGNTLVNWSWLFIVFVIYMPLLIAVWLAKPINLYFLSSSKNYNLYLKFKENKNKYEVRLKEYKNYLEKIRKEEARKVINQSFEYLLKLKQKLFNKSVFDDNYEDFLEFQNIIKELQKYKKDMTWKEGNFYYTNFEKYIRSREKQLDEVVQKYKADKLYKEREEIIIEENEDIEKIVIDESEVEAFEETGEDKQRQRTFIGRKVDFEEVNKENASLGLKGEKVILNYEKEFWKSFNLQFPFFYTNIICK